MLGKKMTLYINPLGLDYLEAEAKNSATMMRYIQSDTQEVMAGLTVDSIRTALGAIPIIPEPFLIKNAYGSAAPAGTNNYPFALVCEDLIEYHYIGSKTPPCLSNGNPCKFERKLCRNFIRSTCGKITWLRPRFGEYPTIIHFMYGVYLSRYAPIFNAGRLISWLKSKKLLKLRKLRIRLKLNYLFSLLQALIRFTTSLVQRCFIDGVAEVEKDVVNVLKELGLVK